jgi:hypothetical protein
MQAVGATFGETREISGYWHRQVLTVAPDAQVLARFADGAPAIVRHHYGAGTAFYCATHLDMAYAREHSPAIRSVFAAMATAAGLEPETRLFAEGTVPAYLTSRIDARLMERGDERLVILTNNGDQDVSLRVVVPAITSIRGSRVLITHSASEVRAGAGGLTWSLDLPAGRSAVLACAGVNAAESGGGT